MDDHARILEQGQHTHSFNWTVRHGLERIAGEKQYQGEEDLVDSQCGQDVRSYLPHPLTASCGYHSKDGEEPEPQEPGAGLTRPECRDGVDEREMCTGVAVDVRHLEIVTQ
jgi:hypothetical protein